LQSRSTTFYNLLYSRPFHKYTAFSGTKNYPSFYILKFYTVICGHYRCSKTFTISCILQYFESMPDLVGLKKIEDWDLNFCYLHTLIHVFNWNYRFEGNCRRPSVLLFSYFTYYTQWAIRDGPRAPFSSLQSPSLVSGPCSSYFSSKLLCFCFQVPLAFLANFEIRTDASLQALPRGQNSRSRR